MRPTLTAKSGVKSYLRLAHSTVGLKLPSAVSRDSTCTTPLSSSDSVMFAWAPKSLSGVKLQLRL